MIDKNILEFMNSLSEKQLEVFKNNFRYSEELTINNLVRKAHNNAVNKGFWEDYRNAIAYIYDDRFLEKSKVLIINSFLTLIASEVFEAQAELRKGNKEAFREEIADIFIRAADLCGGLEIDIEEEIKKKMEKNKGREKMHGKLF